MSIRSSWLIELFVSSASLQISHLFLLSVTKIGVLKSPTVIVDFSVSPFISVSFCCMYFETLWFGQYTFLTVPSSCERTYSPWVHIILVLSQVQDNKFPNNGALLKLSPFRFNKTREIKFFCLKLEDKKAKFSCWTAHMRELEALPSQDECCNLGPPHPNWLHTHGDSGHHPLSVRGYQTSQERGVPVKKPHLPTSLSPSRERRVTSTSRDGGARACLELLTFRLPWQQACLKAPFFLPQKGTVSWWWGLTLVTEKNETHTHTHTDVHTDSTQLKVKQWSCTPSFSPAPCILRTFTRSSAASLGWLTTV